MSKAEPTSHFRRLLILLGPYRGKMLQALLLTGGLSAVTMIPPLVVRTVVNRVIDEGHSRGIVLFGAALVLFPLLISVLRACQTMVVAYVGQRFVFDLRQSLYRHLLALSMRFYGMHSSGMLANRLIGDSTVVQTALTAQSIYVISDLVCATFAVTAAFLISWRLALVVGCALFFFVLNYRMNITRIREATRSYQGAVDRLSGGIQNRLTTTVAVKSFGAERREQTAFQDSLNSSVDLVVDAMRANNTFNLNTFLIQQLGQLCVYFSGCALVLQDRLKYGDVMAVAAYSMQLLMPAVRFSQIAKQLEQVGVSVDRLFELYSAEPEVVDKEGGVELGRARGAVEFDHVAFQYVPDTPVIRDFNLDVRPGQTVALIGPTGCGKSTILSLIMRFFDVCGGTLRIDGHDIRDISLRSLRSQFGIVLQEPLLFDMSVAENIRYGRPGASMDEVIAAARAAEIHDTISALPDHYESLVGSEGVELSVGEKQRITIARAIVADPAILIMDEATSSLDSNSERAIQRAMGSVLKGRTSFVVAHRLSTIRNADAIVLLDKGTIMEMGNHEQLMALPHGRYRELYEKHMGQGVLEE